MEGYAGEEDVAGFWFFAFSAEAGDVFGDGAVDSPVSEQVYHEAGSRRQRVQAVIVFSQEPRQEHGSDGHDYGGHGHAYEQLEASSGRGLAYLLRFFHGFPSFQGLSESGQNLFNCLMVWLVV